MDKKCRDILEFQMFNWNVEGIIVLQSSISVHNYAVPIKMPGNKIFCA